MEARYSRRLAYGPLVSPLNLLKRQRSALPIKLLVEQIAATPIRSASTVKSAALPAISAATGSAAAEPARTACAVARTIPTAAECVAQTELFAVMGSAAAAQMPSVLMANAAALGSSATACAAIRTKFAVTVRGAWISTNPRSSVNNALAKNFGWRVIELTKISGACRSS